MLIIMPAYLTQAYMDNVLIFGQNMRQWTDSHTRSQGSCTHVTVM